MEEGRFFFSSYDSVSGIGRWQWQAAASNCGFLWAQEMLVIPKWVFNGRSSSRLHDNDSGEAGSSGNRLLLLSYAQSTLSISVPSEGPWAPAQRW